MEYNTNLKRMAFPEYGRNIQLMVDYAVECKEPEKKEKLVKAIIEIMGNLNPHLRDIEDFKHKLWDQLAIMSDFKLELNSPYPLPNKDSLNTKPNRVEYFEGELKYKHFGRIVENLIKKALKIDNKEEKYYLIKTNTNHMKKSYLLWNKENIADEVIFETLKDISKGQLIVEDGSLKLDDSQNFMNKKSASNNQNRNRNRSMMKNQRTQRGNHQNNNNRWQKKK